MSFNEIELYTKYFLKVSVNNKITLLYRLLFPLIIVSFQMSSGNMHPQLVIPWCAYMLFSSAVNTVIEISILREQGYLKQYHTLINGNKVFILSKAIVEFLMMAISSLLFILLVAVLNETHFWEILRIYPALLLSSMVVYIPLIQLCLFFLTLPLDSQQIIAVGNVSMVLTIVLTFFSQKLNLFADFFRLINPIAFITEIINICSGYPINYPLYVYATIIMIYIVGGCLSYKKIRILPQGG